MKIAYGIIGLVLILSSQMVHATTYGRPIGPVSIQMPFMKTNSNGTITIQYTEYYPHNSTMDTKFAIYDDRLQNPEPLALNDLTIQAEPKSINLLENNTVTYTVVAKNNIKGVYAIAPISASCGKYPLVIGLNESEIMPVTLFRLSMPIHCGAISSDTPVRKIINYDQIILKDVTRTLDQFSPIEQIQLGSNSTDIQCKQGFDVIIKAHDNMPACVKPDTANILIKRGWVTNVSTSNHMISAKTNDPFGMTALIIYHPPDVCINPPSHSMPSMPSCPPNNFYLKINSNSTAYLLGYNICDDNSCATNNDLSVVLPLNTGINPNYQMMGLPVTLQWKYGDVVHIQLEISHNADNRTASLVDLGNSKIVP